MLMRELTFSPDIATASEERCEMCGQLKTEQSVLGSLDAWEVRYALPHVFEPDPAKAAALVERWAYLFAREICREANGLLRGCTRAIAVTNLN